VKALPFYFGYVSARAQYAYFGVDVDVLGLGTRDYVMRSPQGLLVPGGTPEEGQRYRYRYSGLRLLVQAGDRMSWSRTAGPRATGRSSSTSTTSA
jgi:hypothetical protein